MAQKARFAAFGLLVGHWWHSGRSHAVASRLAFGLSRVYEPVLFLRPVDWSKQDLCFKSVVMSTPQLKRLCGLLQSVPEWLSIVIPITAVFTVLMVGMCRVHLIRPNG